MRRRRPGTSSDGGALVAVDFSGTGFLQSYQGFPALG